MPADQLVEYFRQNLSRGYSEEQIVSFLLSQGYDEGRVRASAAAATGSSAAPNVPDAREAEVPHPVFEKQGNFFSRSFMMIRASWTVIRRRRSMLLFPLLASVFSLAFIVALLFPSLLAPLLFDEGAPVVDYVLLFITYLGLSLISTFFNVCVVRVAHQELRAKPTGFGDALRFAFSRFHLILGWGLLSASVGTLMHLIERFARRLPLAGFIVVLVLQKLLGLLWSILALFAIPAMVVDGVGPFAALKNASRSLRRAWGEGFVMYFGLGGAYFLFFVAGGLLFTGSFVLLSAVPAVSLLVLVVFAVYLIGGIFLFGVMNKVFFTALYLYASTGAVPDGFPPSMLQSAFKPKKKR